MFKPRIIFKASLKISGVLTFFVYNQSVKVTNFMTYDEEKKEFLLYYLSSIFKWFL